MTTEQKAEAYERLARDYADFDTFDYWFKNTDIPSIVLDNGDDAHVGDLAGQVYEFVREVNNEA